MWFFVDRREGIALVPGLVPSASGGLLLPCGAGVVSCTRFPAGVCAHTAHCSLHLDDTARTGFSGCTVPWIQDAKEPQGLSTHFMLGGKLFLLLILVLTEAVHVHY